MDMYPLQYIMNCSYVNISQGSRGRRIRRPGTKKIGLGRMVLLRDDSTDTRFFRHEASQNSRYFTLVLMFISHRVFDDIVSNHWCIFSHLPSLIT